MLGACVNVVVECVARPRRECNSELIKFLSLEFLMAIDFCFCRIAGTCRELRSRFWFCQRYQAR